MFFNWIKIIVFEFSQKKNFKNLPVYLFFANYICEPLKLIIFRLKKNKKMNKKILKLSFKI